MKEYTLKFGLQYQGNIWHVCTTNSNDYVAYCDYKVFMGYIRNDPDPNYYVYPIEKPLWEKAAINLNYKNLCKHCKKKFQLTKEDINHYIVLAKFGIKI